MSCNCGVLDLLTGEPGTDLLHDDETFHAHVLDLKPVSEESACSDIEGSALEVDIGRTLATGNNISPDWPVKVKNNKISVSGAPVSDLQSEDLVAAVSFGIVGLADETNTITNLCLV